MSLGTERFALVVDSVRGPSFVQDGGRAGFMHHAVPPGGALVPERLAASNRALGNAWHAPALEIFGGVTLHAVDGPAIVSLDGEPITVATGEALVVDPSLDVRARYLAIAGGFDVPLQLGGRGTLRSIALGGLEGRALRRGDRLVSCAHAPRTAHTLPVSLDLAAPIRVVAGPDVARFAPDALDSLMRAAFTVAPESDRVGARLDGPTLARVDTDDGTSRPMVRGAIEVPSDGRAIVLGPDHPTTGGYPVLAVVIRADHGVFAARRPGATVRFALTQLADARAAWRALSNRWFLDDAVSADP